MLHFDSATALYQAIVSGNAQDVADIIYHSDPPLWKKVVKSATSEHKNLLLLAIKNHEILSLLLKKYGNDCDDYNKEEAFDDAAHYGYTLSFQLILDHYPDDDSLRKDSAFYLAVRMKRREIIDILLIQCANDISIESKIWAIEYAVAQGYCAMIKFLFQYYGHELSPAIKGHFLTVASQNGRKNSLRTLLEIDPILQEFGEKIKKIFLDVTHFILKEYTLSKKQNKPFMILVGELHAANNDLVLEAIITFIANRYLKANKVFTESVCKKWDPLYRLQNYTAKYLIEFIERFHLTRIELEELITDFDFAISSAGIKGRNAFMANTAIRFVEKGNTVTIVGGIHVYGLLKKTELANTYHIKTINLIPEKMRNEIKNQFSSFDDSYDDVDVALEYLFSEHCHQFSHIYYFGDDPFFLSNSSVIECIPSLCDLLIEASPIELSHVKPVIFSNVGACSNMNAPLTMKQLQSDLTRWCARSAFASL